MAETLTEIEQNFALLENWEDRYRYIIELGAELAPYPEAARNAAHKVPGCVSQVWLLAETETAEQTPRDPVLYFKGDSDAHIVKGLVYIILAFYSGKKASEILAADAQALLARLSLEEHLTPQRSNGLRAMIGRIRAAAEQSLQS